MSIGAVRSECKKIKKQATGIKKNLTKPRLQNTSKVSVKKMFADHNGSIEVVQEELQDKTDLLFVGHCTAEDMQIHSIKFMQELRLDTDLLLGVGLDGPNVNSKFQKRLMKRVRKGEW